MSRCGKMSMSMRHLSWLISVLRYHVPSCKIDVNFEDMLCFVLERPLQGSGLILNVIRELYSVLRFSSLWAPILLHEGSKFALTIYRMTKPYVPAKLINIKHKTSDAFLRRPQAITSSVKCPQNQPEGSYI